MGVPPISPRHVNNTLYIQIAYNVLHNKNTSEMGRFLKSML